MALSGSDLKRVLTILMQAKDQISGPSRVAVRGLRLLARAGTTAMRAVAKAATLPLRPLLALTRPLNLLRAAMVALPIASIISQASEAQETFSKFDAVFKENAAEVRAWSEEYAASVGRSRVETAGFLATLQDTFVPLGFARDQAGELSKATVRLADDLTSFNPTAQNTEETMTLLTSAIVGNHEAVRRFGIIITEASLKQELMNLGLEGGAKAASEQQKVLARLSIILRSTEDAQGDLLRTADSYKNSMDRLRGAVKDTSVALGTPFLRPLAEGATLLSVFLRENEDGVRRFAEGMVLNLGVAGVRLKAFFDLVRELRSDPERANDLGVLFDIAGELAVTAIKETTIAGFKTLGNVIQIEGRPILLASLFLGRKIGTAIWEGVQSAFGESDVQQLEELIRQRTERAASLAAAELELGPLRAQVDAVFAGGDQPGRELSQRYNRVAESVRLLSGSVAGLDTQIGETTRRLTQEHVEDLRLFGDHLNTLIDETKEDIGDIGTAWTLAGDEMGKATDRAHERLAFLASGIRVIGTGPNGIPILFARSSDAVAEFNQRIAEAPALVRAWIDTQDAAVDSTDEYAAALERIRTLFKELDAARKQSNEDLDDEDDKLKELDRTGAGLFDRLADGTRDWRDSLRESGVELAKLLAKLATKAAIGKLFPDFDLSAPFTSLFGSARGNVLRRGELAAFAAGGLALSPGPPTGLITRPTLFPMARGFGLAGEAGTEVGIAPLARTPSGRLGVEAVGAGGGQPVNINFNVTAADARSFDQLLAERGKTITDIVRAAIERRTDFRQQIRDA